MLARTCGDDAQDSGCPMKPTVLDALA
jgi:hypothetical protein